LKILFIFYLCSFICPRILYIHQWRLLWISLWIIIISLLNCSANLFITQTIQAKQSPHDHIKQLLQKNIFWGFSRWKSNLKTTWTLVRTKTPDHRKDSLSYFFHQSSQIRLNEIQKIEKKGWTSHHNFQKIRNRSSWFRLFWPPPPKKTKNKRDQQRFNPIKLPFFRSSKDHIKKIKWKCT
jgi:hypothetical protein